MSCARKIKKEKKILHHYLPLVQKTQVHQWVTRWRSEDEDTALHSRVKSGQPPKLSAADREMILQFVADNPTTNARAIIERLNLQCCPRTVRNFLHGSNVHCRRPAKKVDMTQQHAECRLNFAMQNLDRDWSHVIFTDEKTFCTSQDGKKLVWRPNHTRFLPQNIVRTRRSSRLSLAYWGWMSAAGPGELTRIDTRMDAVEYIRILEDVMLPSVRLLYPPPTPITFVQDNSSVHTSRIVREWFNEHPDIVPLNWPPKSPDLNPIENLWAIMGQMWEHDLDAPPRNRQTLHGHVTRIWESLRGRPTCHNLVTSVSGRMQETIDNHGLWTSH